MTFTSSYFVVINVSYWRRWKCICGDNDSDIKFTYWSRLSLKLLLHCWFGPNELHQLWPFSYTNLTSVSLIVLYCWRWSSVEQMHLTCPDVSLMTWSRNSLFWAHQKHSCTHPLSADLVSSIFAYQCFEYLYPAVKRNTKPHACLGLTDCLHHMREDWHLHVINRSLQHSASLRCSAVIVTGVQLSVKSILESCSVPQACSCCYSVAIATSLQQRLAAWNVHWDSEAAPSSISALHNRLCTWEKMFWLSAQSAKVRIGKKSEMDSQLKMVLIDSVVSPSKVEALAYLSVSHAPTGYLYLGHVEGWRHLDTYDAKLSSMRCLL